MILDIIFLYHELLEKEVILDCFSKLIFKMDQIYPHGIGNTSTCYTMNIFTISPHFVSFYHSNFEGCQVHSVISFRRSSHISTYFLKDPRSMHDDISFFPILTFFYLDRPLLVFGKCLISKELVSAYKSILSPCEDGLERTSHSPA